MKHRFRNYMKKGWTVVEVNRKNLYGWNPSSTTQSLDEKIGNQRHYLEMCRWCGDTFQEGTWAATMHAFNGNDRPGLKRFAFKNPKHATLFTIKWL